MSLSVLTTFFAFGAEALGACSIFFWTGVLDLGGVLLAIAEAGLLELADPKRV